MENSTRTVSIDNRSESSDSDSEHEDATMLSYSYADIDGDDSSEQPTTSAVIHTRVAESLRHHLDFTPTSAFLDNVFPCKGQVIDSSIKCLQEKGLCDENGSLTNFPLTFPGKEWKPKGKKYPPKGPLEKALYQPFVRYANTISRHVARTYPSNPSAGRRTIRGMKWFDCSNAAPESFGPSPGTIRTDLACGKWSRKFRPILRRLRKVNHRLSKLRQPIEEGRKRKLEGTDFENEKALVQEEKEVMKRIAQFEHLFWAQFQIVLEAKRDDTPESLRQSRVQVVAHCRAILQDQPDRLFVIGLTLCENLLGLFLVDRSGVIQADSYIDVQKEARTFIRVLASLAAADANELGWDPTMKVVNTSKVDIRKYVEEDLVYSYERDFDTLSSHDLQSARWAIPMPKKIKEGKMSAEREYYITVEVLSGVGVLAFSGRSAMVWKAIKLGDSDCRLHVLKQSWRPLDNSDLDDGTQATSGFLEEQGSDRTFHEGRMWDIGGQGDEVVSFEDVRIGDDFVTISGYCRKNMNHNRSLDPALQKAKKVKPAKLPNEHVYPLDFHELPPAQKPALRGHRKAVLARTCFRSIGISIKFFSNPIELLEVFRGAIRMHQSLFLRGVLHRDISLGNLIICPGFNEATSEYDFNTTTGKVIDLDHSKWIPAKKTKTFREVLDIDVKYAIATLPGHGTDIKSPKELEEIVEFATACFRVIKSFSYAEDRWKALGTQVPKGLKMIEQPDCASTAVADGMLRTGTLPFMSHELLSLQRSSGPLNVIPHAAVHDLDSFFACFLYLVVTRRGGGGLRRTDLDERPDILEFENTYFSPRNAHSMALAKMNGLKFLFHQNSDAGTILDHVHSVFKNLKPLLHMWGKVLHLAYEYREGWEYYCVHDIVLGLIEKTLSELKKANDEPEDFPGYTQAMSYRRLYVKPIDTSYASGEDPSPEQPTAPEARPSTPVRVGSGITPNATPAKRSDKSMSTNSAQPPPKRRKTKPDANAHPSTPVRVESGIAPNGTPAQRSDKSMTTNSAQPPPKRCKTKPDAKYRPNAKPKPYIDEPMED